MGIGCRNLMKNMRNKKLPLVSVVMPVYNAGRYLNESVKSIVKQTYKNWELIIVNDASTDNSLDILKQYKRKYPQKIKIINLLKQLDREGDPATNLAIKLAKGKYIAKMDADDTAHPKRLLKQLEYLENNKQIFLVGCSANVINNKGKIIGEKIMPSNPLEIYKEYINFHPIIHPSIMFRNKVIKRKDFYMQKYSSSNDYYTLFSLLCQNHRFANLKEKLLNYRIYGGNVSFKNIKKKFMNTLHIKLEIAQKFYYPITMTAVMQTLMQSLAVFLLPEKISFYLYLLTKKIMKPEDILEIIKTGSSVRFSYLIKYSRPLLLRIMYLFV